jgi:predicted Zn-dependent protease with MMP-like domain
MTRARFEQLVAAALQTIPKRFPERTWGDANRLPDRITIYQQPIEEDAEDEDDVLAIVAETVIHEFGHYFGLSEEEIEEIEERYWNGEDLDNEGQERE